MRPAWIIAWTVIADAVRRKVVWVVLLFAALLALVIPSLPSYGVGVVGAVYREVVIALMFAAAFVVAIALSATRVPGEVERRTVFSVLARDVRRWHYIFGTWLGMLAVVGVVVGLLTVVAIVFGGVVYKEWMWVLSEAAVAVWFEMGAIMAFTIMMSTRFGVVTSSVAAIAFTFIGHSIGTVVSGGAGGQTPWYIPSLEAFNVINPVAHGTGYGFVYAGSMTLTFAAWCGLLLLAAAAIFERRDL